MAEKERIVIFVDGENFYSRLLERGKQAIDFKKFIGLISKGRDLVGVYYYDAYYIQHINPTKYAQQRSWIAYIKTITQNVFIVKRNKKFDKFKNRMNYIAKGDDIYLASHMVKFAYTNTYDTAILITGDGDFYPAVMIVNESGKKVENYYLDPNFSWLLKKVCSRCEEITPIVNQC